MTDSAKQHILSNLRRARSNAEIKPWQSTAPSETTPDIERFKQVLQQNHAEVHEITEAQLNASIDNWLAAEQLSGAMVIAQHPELSTLKPQLTKELRFIEIGALDKATLFDSVTLSICFADGGVADKGALLIKASAYQPRNLSLVPPISILAIKKKSILSNLAAAFSSTHFTPKTLPSNTVLISGPSKTADIQQTLAYGAHGPKRLIVFLLT